MPIVNITMGELTTEKKKEIITKVTETLVEITGLPEDKFMTVIDEKSYENLGIGTKTVAELVANKS